MRPTFTIRDLLWFVMLWGVVTSWYVYRWRALEELSRVQAAIRVAEREALNWRLVYEKHKDAQ